MTPEKKAKELFNKMLRYDNGRGGMAVSKAWAKYAAVNCCDEIIDALTPLVPKVQVIWYWQQVKTEIKKL